MSSAMRRNCQEQIALSYMADSFSIRSRSMTHLKKLDRPVSFSSGTLAGINVFARTLARLGGFA